MSLTPARSPCIGICELDDATGLCRGCLRDVGEIMEWRDADEVRRREILAAIGARRACAQHVCAPAKPPPAPPSRR